MNMFSQVAISSFVCDSVDNPERHYSTIGKQLVKFGGMLSHFGLVVDKNIHGGYFLRTRCTHQ